MWIFTYITKEINENTFVLNKDRRVNVNVQTKFQIDIIKHLRKKNLIMYIVK